VEYLTKNQKLIEELNKMGFNRKNINIFRKIENESILDLYFSHYTSGEPHVKYYTVNVNITYPTIEKIKQKGGFNYEIPPVGLWNDLQSLIPNSQFLGFRVAESDDEQMVKKTVGSLCGLIGTYALPLMKKYSNPRAFIADYENGKLGKIHINKKSMALLYLIYEGKEKALHYAKTQLDKLKEKEPKEPTVSIHEGKLGNTDSTTISVTGNELPLWEDLYEKIKDFQ
jgi:hypothetical protein